MTAFLNCLFGYLAFPFELLDTINLVSIVGLDISMLDLTIYFGVLSIIIGGLIHTSKA